MFKRKTKLKSDELHLKAGEEEHGKLVQVNQSDNAVAVQTAGEGNSAYAGFLRRTVADILDWLIITGLTFILGLPGAIILMMYVTIPQFLTPQINQPLALIFVAIFGLMMAVGMLLPWLYIAFSESSRRQATPGKLFVGLKVTDEKGQNIGFWRSTWKAVLVVLLTYSPFWIAGSLQIFMTNSEQSLPVIFLCWFGMLSPFLFVLYMLCNEKKQTVYDKLAKRLVVVHGRPNVRMIVISTLVSGAVIGAGFASALVANDFVKKKGDEINKEHRNGSNQHLSK